MFSMTTIASSTTSPVASVSPKRVSVLIEKPKSFTKAKVPSSETGMVMAGMSVDRSVCRKRKMVAMTRTMACRSVTTTSLIDALTGAVVSKAVSQTSPGGNSLASLAMAASTFFFTSSALEPGSCWMPRPTARLPLQRDSCE